MKRPYFKLILGAVFWLSATIILAALMISAATVSTTLTSFPTDSTPFMEALWGTPYANESTQGYLGALVFWFFLFAQYIAAIGLFVSATRNSKKGQQRHPVIWIQQTPSSSSLDGVFCPVQCWAAV